MKIEIEISEKHEGTQAPWWMIIDPKQNLRTDKEASYNIASMITGPFFSRESAQEYLDARRYNFGRNAVVYCESGHANYEYNKKIIAEQLKQTKKARDDEHNNTSKPPVQAGFGSVHERKNRS